MRYCFCDLKQIKYGNDDFAGFGLECHRIRKCIGASIIQAISY